MYKEKLFDYYIFMDYSENLIGYIIIKFEKISELIKKTSKLKHYARVKYKKEYLRAMKKLFERDELLSYLEKHSVKELRQNIEACSEIFDFCDKNPISRIFISIDDRQYHGFMRIAEKFDGNRFTIVKEGKLKKGSKEYQLNLIIDTLLNLKRTRSR